MRPAKASRLRYLKLDSLAADPQLARLLPPEVAWRYHALPLAEDHGRVTVAMADPGDTVAREAVVTALGSQACVVQGDPVAIDTLLATIWESTAQCPPNVQVFGIADPDGDEVWVYAQALGGLLGARADLLDPMRAMDALFQEGGTQCDLVVIGWKDRSLIHRMLSQPVTDELTAAGRGGVPFGVLVARRPRWPLEHILLVLCCEGADDGAVDWALRLAQPSNASITILAIVTPVPTMYHGLSRMEQSVAALLTTDTVLGRQMRQVARRLAECKVDGIFRLRQGVSDQQISQEVLGGDHDLMIMATKPCRWWLRQLRGDPLCSLLNGVDRPVLLARPTME